MLYHAFKFVWHLFSSNESCVAFLSWSKEPFHTGYFLFPSVLGHPSEATS